VKREARLRAERPEIITAGVAAPCAHVTGITSARKFLSDRSKNHTQQGTDEGFPEQNAAFRIIEPPNHPYLRLTNMNVPVTTSFDPALVALSFFFAVTGSLIALTAASSVKTGKGRIRLSSALTIGVALGGIGVWSMHFIGMLALQMDVGSSYSMTETMLSLAVVVVAASLAVSHAAQRPDSLPRLLGCGFALGMSVVVMHYLGMFGLKIYGFISWDYGIVALSMLIAVVAATAALWLALNTPTVQRRVLASLVMGVAVCAMHYTGMAAAEFVCTTSSRTAIPQGTDYISSFRLPTLVIVTTVLMILMLSFEQFMQHQRAKPAPLAAPPGR
jgi:NO-binding membrane sensor protein with MHYT domain